nr:hypothetical protein [Tanacetum cinerariifolium]
MPSKMMKRKAIKKMVKKQIKEAIEEYEKTRANPCNVGTEGVVGLWHWVEKVEQVFEICKCAEEDKVMFAASTFEGRALTWFQRTGHQEKDCRARVPGAGDNSLQNVMCFGCGDKGHYKNRCPKARNQHNEGAHGRAYVVIENPQQNPNVVTKLADGKVVSTNTILRGCTIALFNHVFKIDLLPTRLGSLDVIVGMDWSSYHQVVIVCYEKIVRIPLSNGEILEVQGERPKMDPRSLSCIKADVKKPEDIRIVRDFPEVFLDNLTGLPLVREIEFHIDLIPGALPVVKSPYRLAPSEMLELSNQPKEL